MMMIDDGASLSFCSQLLPPNALVLVTVPESGVKGWSYKSCGAGCGADCLGGRGADVCPGKAHTSIDKKKTRQHSVHLNVSLHLEYIPTLELVPRWELAGGYPSPLPGLRHPCFKVTDSGSR